MVVMMAVVTLVMITANCDGSDDFDDDGGDGDGYRQL